MLVSISREIRFGTLEVIPNSKSTVLLKGLKSILQVYQRGGFQVEAALMDGEFGHLRGELASMGVTLNETSRDEHVGEIERFIRTIKERMRAIYNTLPFQKIPARLVAEMGKACVFWLNSLPPQSNFGNDLSPRTIVTGQRLDFKRHCRFQFGEYVQTHEQHNNSMMSRTVGALALRPTGNAQGGFYFLSLSTGRVLNRLQATALPMPDNVVDQVHRMARQQRANPGLMFGSRSHAGTANDDDENDESDNEEDEDYMPEEQEGDGSDDGYEEDANGLDDHNHEDVGSIVSEPDEHGDDDATNMGDADIGTEMQVRSGRSPDACGADTDATPEVVDTNKRANNHVESKGVDGPDMGSEGVDEQSNDVVDPDGNEVELVEEKIDNDSDKDESRDSVGTRDNANEKTGYNLRTNRERSYKHLYDPTVFEAAKNSDDREGVMMTTINGGSDETGQMSMKKGLKVFGEPGYAAVKKEMQQLHDRKVMQPVDRKDLSPSQKKEALGYLMFLKKKRCGAIKGRGCADGRKQRAYITKEESTSPTVSTEAAFLTAVVDAWENRKVAVLDVPGAFMQVEMDELVHVRFEGEMVDKLLEIDHDLYAGYVTVENGKKVMYVELLKALYGTLRAARLFWEKLQAKLVNEWGFTPNRYDSCVVNKMVGGRQLTVAWHVDDLKILHEEEDALDEFISMMEAEFGEDSPLSVS